jgi:hypothetical protein
MEKAKELVGSEISEESSSPLEEIEKRVMKSLIFDRRYESGQE